MPKLLLKKSTAKAPAKPVKAATPGLSAALGKLAAPAPSGGVHRGSTIVRHGNGLTESSLKNFDIPIDRLVAHKENPNEQSEGTFDELVERIREEGFDEAIIVVPELNKGQPTGKYLITSGHHRVKAAGLAGMTSVPAVIREGWDEDRVLMELVSRNELRGALNAHKFTELWEKLSKRYDPEILKRQMGLTNKKQFDALFKQVKDALPPKQKAILEAAKERVNSVEDLSSVLNEIFEQHGSKLDHSFMVMSYGGKDHFYIQVSANLHKTLAELKKESDRDNIDVGRLFEELLADAPKVGNLKKKLKNTRSTQ